VNKLEGSNLNPNINEAQRFLNVFSGSLTFQTFHDQDRGKSGCNRIFHGTLDEHAADLTRLNQQGCGIFLQVNRGDGKGRKRENVIKVRSVFVDFDTPGGLEKLKAAFPPPHIIVESSPDKCHGYWLVANFPLDEFGAMQKALAARFDSDKTITERNRVMRLPGFYHQKGDPFMTRIVEGWK
jgi:putative DNA primase/helicase